jgi:hypothetical protein
VHAKSEHRWKNGRGPGTRLGERKASLLDEGTRGRKGTSENTYIHIYTLIIPVHIARCILTKHVFHI